MPDLPTIVGSFPSRLGDTIGSNDRLWHNATRQNTTFSQHATRPSCPICRPLWTIFQPFPPHNRQNDRLWQGKEAEWQQQSFRLIKAPSLKTKSWTRQIKSCTKKVSDHLARKLKTAINKGPNWQSLENQTIHIAISKSQQVKSKVVLKGSGLTFPKLQTATSKGPNWQSLEIKLATLKTQASKW